MKLPRILLTLAASTSMVAGCTEPTQPHDIPSPPTRVDPEARPGYYVYLADASGADLRRLAGGSSPAWSPDGNRIAFKAQENGTSFGIYVADAGGPAQRQLTPGDGWSPRWSPDGSRIAFVTCNPFFTNDRCDVTFNVINADGSGGRSLALIKSPGTIPPAEWSPDGKKITFVDAEGVRPDLYVINADGTNRTRLTRLGTVRGADWSPDGRKLAVRAAGSVYVIDADGSNPVRLPDAADSPAVLSAEWSPKGDRIALGLETKEIHVVNPDGTNRVIVATHASAPHWLPDGRTLSFQYRGGIWVVPAAGGAPSPVITDGFDARWSPDGSRIAYVKHHR